MEKFFNMVQQKEKHKSVMVSREQRYKSIAVFFVSQFARPNSIQGEKNHVQTLWEG